MRDIVIILVCVVLAAGFFYAAGSQLDYINNRRAEMGLVINEPLENAPPSLAFATVAMGAFRGLVVNVLWIRADRLKEEKQFFDAKQLAEWITVLQPRFASVWEFQAWNMAYNISVSLPATQPAERWRWVKNGYELLRDRGIPLNPRSITLYREMARIFQHKIAGVTDEAHKYYKLQLALAMEPLVGPATNEYFRKLAETPDTWQQAVTGDVRDMVDALKVADGAFAGQDGFVGNYLLLRSNPGVFDAAAIDVIDRYRDTAAMKKLDLFARAWQLRNVWKLDPSLMLELNRTYGPAAFEDLNEHNPLDWRHPDSHALYWAVKGLKVAGKNQYSVDQANTDRLVGHSLQDLFYNGKLYIHSVPSEDDGEMQREVFLRPDLRMFDSCNRSRLAILDKYKTLDPKSYESLQKGHRNLLKNAVLLFYQAGLHARAQSIYDQIGKLYPGDDVKVPLAVFARDKFYEEMKSLSLNDAKQAVVMLLREAYFRYAMRDDDEAFGREKMAREIYDEYQGRYSDQDRIDLPRFQLLRYFAMMDFLNDWQFPLSLRQGLMARIKVERPDLAEQLMREEEELVEKLGK